MIIVMPTRQNGKVYIICGRKEKESNENFLLNLEWLVEFPHGKLKLKRLICLGCMSELLRTLRKDHLLPPLKGIFLVQIVLNETISLAQTSVAQ